jgi:hypothetical protein
LQQLFENDSILTVLACSDANPMGLQGLSDSGMTENVIRRSRLFNEAVFML